MKASSDRRTTSLDENVRTPLGKVSGVLRTRGTVQKLPASVQQTLAMRRHMSLDRTSPILRVGCDSENKEVRPTKQSSRRIPSCSPHGGILTVQFRGAVPTEQCLRTVNKTRPRARSATDGEQTRPRARSSPRTARPRARRRGRQLCALPPRHPPRAPLNGPDRR